MAVLLCYSGLSSAQARWCPEPTNQLVNDYGKVLLPSEMYALEKRLVAFDDSTSNQILVVITPTLHDEEIMDVGTRIGTTWGVGQKDLKNGVVILIKSKTGEDDYGDVAILPGYGLEGALPDVFCNRIITEKMVPELSEGRYYEALVAALDIIEPVCRGEYSFDEYKSDDRRAVFFAFSVVLLLIVIVFIVATIYNKNHPNNNDGDHFSSDGDDRRKGRSYAGPIFWGGLPRGGFGGGGFGGGFGGGSGGFGGFGGGSFGGGGSHGRF